MGWDLGLYQFQRTVSGRRLSSPITRSNYVGPQTPEPGETVGSLGTPFAWATKASISYSSVREGSPCLVSGLHPDVTILVVGRVKRKEGEKGHFPCPEREEQAVQGLQGFFPEADSILTSVAAKKKRERDGGSWKEYPREACLVPTSDRPSWTSLFLP